MEIRRSILPLRSRGAANRPTRIRSAPEVENIRIPVEFPEGDHPLRQAPGSAEQVGQLILFLASDDSSHITGTEIYIDGAESLLRG